MRKRLGAVVAAAIIASIAVPQLGGASPGNHTIAGGATNGPDTFLIGGTITEVPPTGTGILNGFLVSVDCVTVFSGLPGIHEVIIRAVGGGAVWWIYITEAGGAQTLYVTNTSGSGPCGIGSFGTPPVVGLFVIV